MKRSKEYRMGRIEGFGKTIAAARRACEGRAVKIAETLNVLNTLGPIEGFGHVKAVFLAVNVDGIGYGLLYADEFKGRQMLHSGFEGGLREASRSAIRHVADLGMGDPQATEETITAGETWVARACSAWQLYGIASEIDEEILYMRKRRAETLTARKAG